MPCSVRSICSARPYARANPIYHVRAACASIEILSPDADIDDAGKGGLSSDPSQKGRRELTDLFRAMYLPPCDWQITRYNIGRCTVGEKSNRIDSLSGENKIFCNRIFHFGRKANDKFLLPFFHQKLNGFGISFFLQRCKKTSLSPRTDTI